MSLSCTILIAQQKEYKSCVKLSKEAFECHQPIANFVVKPFGKIKSEGVIRIKTPLKTIVLKDYGEFLEYRFQGYIKNTQFVLIHELKPNTEEYYLINRKTATIDTLVGKPIFAKNGIDIVCLEGQSTDMKQRIQIGRIKNGRFITEKEFKLNEDEFISADYIYWYNNHTVYIKADKNFWSVHF